MHENAAQGRYRLLNYGEICENTHLNFKLFTFDNQSTIIPFESQSILRIWDLYRQNYRIISS
ncbi:hypothetical protein K080096A4_40060 [[Clostridium] innocuum]